MVNLPWYYLSQNSIQIGNHWYYLINEKKKVLPTNCCTLEWAKTLNFIFIIVMIWPLITLITILLINLESSLAQRIDEVASIKADTSQESKAPILIIQPKYMRSEVVMMIPKARNTVYSAGYLSKLGLTNFKCGRIQDEI